MPRRAPLAALLLAVAPVQASDLLGQVDPAFSRADFSLRVVWVRKLEGRFEYIQGSVIEAAEPHHFDVSVQIAAQSLSMRNPTHADWARSAEFFNVDHHPWISFQARNAPQSLLAEGGELVGELSLRGVTRPATFEVLPSNCQRPGFDCPLEARGEVNRSEFGMDARRWAVSDKVRLALSIRVRDEVNGS